MNSNKYHVIPAQDGRWSVKRGGTIRANRTFEVKTEAINFGRSLASSRNGELVIHKKDGSIQNANSYGIDPNPPKDKKINGKL